MSIQEITMGDIVWQVNSFVYQPVEGFSVIAYSDGLSHGWMFMTAYYGGRSVRLVG